MSFWWLSFAAEGPGGFLGVSIVGPADDITQAALLAHLHQCNPGGEVMGLEFPGDMAAAVLFPEDLNKLMDLETAKAFDEVLKTRIAEHKLRVNKPNV